jgi:low affinity Fe/Cu permease
MSRPLIFFYQVRPALAHFGRCWRQLRRLSSRRTLELALAGVMLSQVFRLLQAIHVLPPMRLSPAPTLHTAASSMIGNANDFYASLWPHPVFWVVLLILGAICTVSGLQQTVAAFQLARTGEDATFLSETGEDDSRFLTSVHTEWLMADVILRRLGMAVGMLFFSTLAWKLLIATGISGLLFVMLLLLYTWVDNRLLETSHKLREIINIRRAAEKDALVAVSKIMRCTSH